MPVCHERTAERMSESETGSPTRLSSPDGTSPSRPRLHALRRLKSIGRGRKSAWAAAMALLVLAGTVASVLGARAVARSEVEKSRLAFHLASAEIASSLKQ